MTAIADEIESSALCGDVICEPVAGRSALTRLYSRNPLKLLSPRHVGVAARVVMSSFGGGMVSGDHVPIRVDVRDGASCILTTQSSSKVYRSNGRSCRQSLEATVGENAFFATLPDPLCCFAGASFCQRQRFDLTESSNLVWLDWITSGRWAREERWQFDSLSTRTDIYIRDKLKLRETLHLDPRDGAIGGAMRMGRFDCYAVVAIVGPKLGGMMDLAEQAVRDLKPVRESGMLASATRFDRGLICRIVGPRAEVVQKWLAGTIASLSGVIGDDPWARKW